MDNLLKKIAIITLLIAPLTLTACFNSTDDSSATESDIDGSYYYDYITAEFSIEAPENWEQITTFTSEYPEEIRVAFRNNIKEGDFIANLAVFREELTSSVTNVDLSQEKLSSHSDSLLDYMLLSQEELALEVSGAESTTFLNTFEGKNDASAQALSFKQIYLTKGDRAWVLTATYLPEEDPFVIEKLDQMLRSFSLK
jgi:hypothetical protein